jgi:hypothetical protein
MKRNVIRSFAMASLFLCIACARPVGNISPQVGKFRTSTETTIAVTRPYLTELNAVERSILFSDARVNKAINIDEKFFAPTFSPKGIQVRLQCFELIDIYTARLADIVNSKASQNLSKNTTALGESLRGLGTTIEGITGDRTIRDYSGPVSSLVNFISEIWIENERSKALTLAVNQASPQVDKVLALLERDLLQAHNARLESALIQYNNLRLDYNSKKNTLSDRERNERLQELERLANGYDQLSSIPPQDVITGMRNAHRAMVQAVADLDNIGNLQNFTDAVEVFSLRVQEAQTIFTGIRNARNNI